MTGQSEKEDLRILRLLSFGPACVEDCARADRIRLTSQRLGTFSASRISFDGLLRRSLVTVSDRVACLTPTGVSAFARMRDENCLGQHVEIGSVSVELPEGRRDALANLSESPLGHLARRKAKDGKPFLEARELRAGERLRADYTRGQLLPRLGANWSAAGTSGRPMGTPGASAELTDGAVAARQRVNAALTGVGPELAGLLVDVCCFLKGLETVEIERAWPARSAKVVLKTALAALARHYEPERKKVSGGSILHWGAEDYRPEMSER